MHCLLRKLRHNGDVTILVKTVVAEDVMEDVPQVVEAHVACNVLDSAKEVVAEVVELHALDKFLFKNEKEGVLDSIDINTPSI